MELALSSFSVRKLALLVGLFCLLLVGCLMVGLFASPKFVVFEEQEFAADDQWLQTVSLSPLNQGMVASVVFQANVAGVSVTKHVEALVTLRGRNSGSSSWTTVWQRRQGMAVVCVEGGDDCEEVEVARVPYLVFESYETEVALLKPPSWITGVRMVTEYVSGQFTLFEIVCRAVFAFLAVCFGGFFLWKLRSTPFRDWADEQKWLLALLVAVLAFDNPLFALSVKWAFFDVVDQLVASSFLSVLLLFWIVVIDSLVRSQEGSSRSFKYFYLPKLALVGVFWIATSSLYLTAELLDDFSHPAVIVCFVLTLLIASGYLFWICFLVFKLVPILRHAQLRVRFFAVFTLGVIAVTICGILFGFLGPLQVTGTEIIVYFALFNGYTFVLVVCYLPNNAVGTNGGIGGQGGDRIQISSSSSSQVGLSDLEDFSTNDFEISLSDVGMNEPPVRAFSPVHDNEDLL